MTAGRYEKENPYETQRITAQSPIWGRTAAWLECGAIIWKPQGRGVSILFAKSGFAIHTSCRHNTNLKMPLVYPNKPCPVNILFSLVQARIFNKFKEIYYNLLASGQA
jgi:hypothetical protein